MQKVAFSLLLLLLPGLVSALTNQLKDHSSPYLAMHGEDPVHWQQWGEAALEQARKENKLLFISSGYFACHWCHVMQRESYQNPRVAALLNRYFIPIKVDRELQPALDEHLIDFVRRTRGHAGWPLNAFLTPEGYPLYGLTYSLSEPFRELLLKLKIAWEKQPQKLTEIARRAGLEVAGMEPVTSSETLSSFNSDDLHLGLVSMALARGDEMQGGFGAQNRFPMAPQWLVLLEQIAVDEDEKLIDFSGLTLDQMANLGLRDHIEGGFFRYTVDPSWQVPHFEKMLYSQALLSRLYLRGAKILKRPDYLDVARDTLDFTLAVMAGKGGGYIASLSAVDPDGVEGGGYLWSDEQLKETLSPLEITFARQRWGLEGSSANEGGYLPMNGDSLDEIAASGYKDVAALEQLESQVRERLLNGRMVRSHPRDEKQLAAWNGLFLSALVEGARVLGDDKYRAAAQALRDYLVNRLWDGKRLLRAESEGAALGRAALEDYAYVAKGLWDWGQLSGSKADQRLSERMVSDAWRRFYRHGGWQATDELLIPGISVETAISDGPLPSPAAELIALTLIQGDPDLIGQAREALLSGFSKVEGQPLWYATHAQVMINEAGEAE